LADGALAESADLLSPDERERADRFRFARDRRDFVAAHALVRSALSAVDRRPPGLLEFAVTPAGKPFLLAAGGRPSPLSFSLTHTHGLVACAIGNLNVGIDAEAMGRDADVDGVSGRFFAPAERAALQRCSGTARRERFFELWTLKESLLKGIGLGLAHPLEDLAFAVGPSGEVSLEAAGIDAASWQFSLNRLAGFCLSVAVERGHSPDVPVHLRQAVLPLPGVLSPR
jgi:4'-phosphopantetheinyl transferase